MKANRGLKKRLLNIRMKILLLWISSIFCVYKIKSFKTDIWFFTTQMNVFSFSFLNENPVFNVFMSIEMDSNLSLRKQKTMFCNILAIVVEVVSSININRSSSCCCCCCCVVSSNKVKIINYKWRWESLIFIQKLCVEVEGLAYFEQKTYNKRPQKEQHRIKKDYFLYYLASLPFLLWRRCQRSSPQG